jgi:hypothetical protein
VKLFIVWLRSKRSKYAEYTAIVRANSSREAISLAADRLAEENGDYGDYYRKLYNIRNCLELSYQEGVLYFDYTGE